MISPLFNLVFVCVLFTASTPLFAQSAATDKTQAAFPSEANIRNATIRYQLIPAANDTWGYDILVDGRTMIHQATIPGQPGNEAFKTKTQAAKVAGMVVDKMKHGAMPPTVTLEEMKALKAL